MSICLGNNNVNHIIDSHELKGEREIRTNYLVGLYRKCEDQSLYISNPCKYNTFKNLVSYKSKGCVST
jgi:hypothetical protein